MRLNKFYQCDVPVKLYGVLDAVGATISTPAVTLDYRAAVNGYVTLVPLVFRYGLFPLPFPARIYFNPEGLFIFR